MATAMHAAHGIATDDGRYPTLHCIQKKNTFTLNVMWDGNMLRNIENVTMKAKAVNV